MLQPLAFPSKDSELHLLAIIVATGECGQPSSLPHQHSKGGGGKCREWKESMHIWPGCTSSVGTADLSPWAWTRCSSMWNSPPAPTSSTPLLHLLQPLPLPNRTSFLYPSLCFLFMFVFLVLDFVSIQFAGDCGGLISIVLCCVFRKWIRTPSRASFFFVTLFLNRRGCLER